MKISKLYQSMWSHLSKKRKLQVNIIIVLMVGTSGLELLSIGAVAPFLVALTNPEVMFNSDLLKNIFSMAGYTESEQILLPITLIFISLSMLSAFLRMLMTWIQTKIGFQIGSDIGAIMYDNCIKQNYSFYSKNNSADLVATLSNKTNSATLNFILPTIGLINAAIFVSIITVGLVMVKPYIAVCALSVFATAYYLIIYVTKKIISQESTRISEETSAIMRHLQNTFGGIKDIILNSAHDIYYEIFEKSNRQLRKSQTTIQVIGSVPRYVVEGMGMSIVAGVAYFMSTKSTMNSQILPVLGVLALAAQRLMPSFQQAYYNLSLIRGSKKIVQDILEMANLKPQIKVKATELCKDLKFNKNIEFIDVSYRHDGQNKNTLKNIFLKINKGEKIGIIGTSGSGKSTFIDLLLGLNLPSTGEIHIDGTPLTSNNLSEWRAHIGHVPQFIYLSDGSVRQNIAFGKYLKDIDSNKIIDAAEKAKILDVIKLMQNGFDSFIGENGANLSGGQRQRIGIARAFYKNANMLVLDEATSALDSETENDIIDSISLLSSDTTLILVAHRINTLKLCDRIFEFKNGEIVGEYSYLQLLSIKSNNTII